MTDKPDVEKWRNTSVVETFGADEAERPHLKWIANTAINAFFAAAAADGFRLVRVPDEMDVEYMGTSGAAHGHGFNACRAATLASAVKVGE